MTLTTRVEVELDAVAAAAGAGTSDVLSTFAPAAATLSRPLTDAVLLADAERERDRRPDSDAVAPAVRTRPPRERVDEPDAVELTALLEALTRSVASDAMGLRIVPTAPPISSTAAATMGAGVARGGAEEEPRSATEMVPWATIATGARSCRGSSAAGARRTLRMCRCAPEWALP